MRYIKPATVTVHNTATQYQLVPLGQAAYLCPMGKQHHKLNQAALTAHRGGAAAVLYANMHQATGHWRMVLGVLQVAIAQAAAAVASAPVGNGPITIATAANPGSAALPVVLMYWPCARKPWQITTPSNSKAYYSLPQAMHRYTKALAALCTMR